LLLGHIAPRQVEPVEKADGSRGRDYQDLASELWAAGKKARLQTPI